MTPSTEKLDHNTVFSHAVGLIADRLVRSTANAAAGRPLILGPDGRPASLLPKQAFQYERRSAGRKGSLKTWIPRQLDTSQAAYEREKIAERAIDLVNNDASASGVVDAFANTVVGPGLLPHPVLDADNLGIGKDAATAIERRQKWVFNRWTPFADASGRMSFAGIAFLSIRQLIQYGEYFFALPMLSTDPIRPYSLSVLPIHPLRVKTPIDLLNRAEIKDGVEMDANGAPKAYWIKKATAGPWSNDISSNFQRISAKAGHRHRIIHGFVVKDPEQVRGISIFSPAMKMFRDLSDYLDAELVSNIVTAAFSLFIESQTANPFDTASAYANLSETVYKSDGTQTTERYEELQPGIIMYGNSNEKPHVIAAQRPGSTFGPFVALIAKSISNACGIPHPVLFRDFAGMNYASYRSAMLEAWRVFNTQRKFLGSNLCGPIWRMLLEESYLRGEFDGYGIRDFYSNMMEFCTAEWVGPPKGQIEPIKEVQADVIAIRNNLKTREETALEQGRDFAANVAKLAEEKAMLEAAGLSAELDESNASGMADSGQDDQDGQDADEGDQ
jgi:lambda family phage portal protein